MPEDKAPDPSQVIADLRRELASRTAERDEALARETATAEVLGVINSSPGDLAPVFDAMLDKALRLCGAASGGLAVFEGTDHYRVLAYKGVPALAQAIKGLMPIHPGSMSQRIRDGEAVIHIEDFA